MKKISLKHIANELGYSISTVSKALHDSPEISREVREKIQAFAKYMNYQPNRLAVKLRNQKTMVIGVIVPEIVHHFFSSVISGIETEANNKQYNIMIGLSNDRLIKEQQLINVLSNGSVDGLLISLSKESLEKSDFSHIERLIEQGFPIVFFDRVPPEHQLNKVIINDITGGFKATEHLIKKGVKKPAILSTPPHITVGKDREKGFLNALKKYNIPANNDFILHINEKKDIHQQIAELFENKPFPDGIFAVNELYASIALKIAQKKGIKIPDELKIIAFTDGIISKTTTPSLTTVAQHGKKMGETAVRILLNCIENPNQTQQTQTIIIPTDIVQRESS